MTKKRMLMFVMVAAGLTFNAWTGVRMARIESWGLVMLSALLSVVLLVVLWSTRPSR